MSNLGGLEWASLLAAGGYFAFLLAEARGLVRARERLRMVIHVNGTRGKTETTRLVAAVLRAGGFRTLAKTTGTEPRLLLEDGSEQRWRRWGAANVREQRDVLRLAACRGAEILVAECMAVSPDAQAASTAFLRPSILVVTNSRPDHEAELGTPEEALAVFAEGIPRDGLVVTADASLRPELARIACQRGASCLVATPEEGLPCHPENAGIALAIAEHLGLPRELALGAIRSHTPDPGAFAIRRLGGITLVDALAANDPVSADQLFRRVEADSGPRLLLLANRRDRPDRALTFARWAAAQPERWDGVLLAGDAVPQVKEVLERAWPGGVRRLSRIEDLEREAEGTWVYATGNWKGLGPALRERAS
jgi:poly-gamma-glutamate synthase PgsB/CapB